MTVDDLKALEDKVAALEASLAAAEKVYEDMKAKVVSFEEAAAKQPTVEAVAAFAAKLEALIEKVASLGKV